jgi:hypothetical protein
MANKKLPQFLDDTIIGKFMLSPIGIILTYWLFQGMRYMDVREVILKLSLDILITCLFIALGVNFLLSILLSHTINMFCNGHFYVLMKNIGRGKTDPCYFIDYVDSFNSRVQKASFLIGAASYGSLSRNGYKPTSDFDVRIFPKNTFYCWLKSVIWVSFQRLQAFLGRFPLDIYVFDLDVVKKKMRADEPPIILSDPNGILAEKYPCHVTYREFSDEFRKTHLQADNKTGSIFR